MDLVMASNPFDEIKNKLNSKIPASLIKYLPKKWEKNGEVLIIVLPDLLKKYEKNIGEVYANVLNCKSVLNDTGGISGEFRKPDNKVIFGSNDTITIHKENGVKFKLDPQKVMFSSGNISERIRMGSISKPDEVVVDLFAGIGYFTLPIAVHSKPKTIFACEKNLVSYNFLCENVSLNNVNSIVQPVFGDNRDVAPTDVANRVVMGYFGATIRFLPTAFRCLKNNSGIIHLHDKFPDDDTSNMTMEHINNEARKLGLIVNLLNHIKVKSFAPGVSHYVFDLEVSER
jgi:tRNA wybutosine-synthesizing protein 2